MKGLSLSSFSFTPIIVLFLFVFILPTRGACVSVGKIHTTQQIDIKRNKTEYEKIDELMADLSIKITEINEQLDTIKKIALIRKETEYENLSKNYLEKVKKKKISDAKKIMEEIEKIKSGGEVGLYELTGLFLNGFVDTVKKYESRYGISGISRKILDNFNAESLLIGNKIEGDPLSLFISYIYAIDNAQDLWNLSYNSYLLEKYGGMIIVKPKKNSLIDIKALFIDIKVDTFKFWKWFNLTKDIGISANINTWFFELGAGVEILDDFKFAPGIKLNANAFGGKLVVFETKENNIYFFPDQNNIEMNENIEGMKKHIFFDIRLLGDKLTQLIKKVLHKYKKKYSGVVLLSPQVINAMREAVLNNDPNYAYYEIIRKPFQMIARQNIKTGKIETISIVPVYQDSVREYLEDQKLWPKADGVRQIIGLINFKNIATEIAALDNNAFAKAIDPKTGEVFIYEKPEDLPLCTPVSLYKLDDKLKMWVIDKGKFNKTKEEVLVDPQGRIVEILPAGYKWEYEFKNGAYYAPYARILGVNGQIIINTANDIAKKYKIIETSKELQVSISKNTLTSGVNLALDKNTNKFLGIIEYKGGRKINIKDDTLVIINGIEFNYIPNGIKESRSMIEDIKIGDEWTSARDNARKNYANEKYLNISHKNRGVVKNEKYYESFKIGSFIFTLGSRDAGFFFDFFIDYPSLSSYDVLNEIGEFHGTDENKRKQAIAKFSEIGISGMVKIASLNFDVYGKYDRLNKNGKLIPVSITKNNNVAIEMIEYLYEITNQTSNLDIKKRKILFKKKKENEILYTWNGNAVKATDVFLQWKKENLKEYGIWWPVEIDGQPLSATQLNIDTAVRLDDAPTLWKERLEKLNITDGNILVREDDGGLRIFQFGEKSLLEAKKRLNWMGIIYHDKGVTELTRSILQKAVENQEIYTCIINNKITFSLKENQIINIMELNNNGIIELSKLTEDMIKFSGNMINYNGNIFLQSMYKTESQFAREGFSLNEKNIELPNRILKILSAFKSDKLSIVNGEFLISQENELDKVIALINAIDKDNEKLFIPITKISLEGMRRNGVYVISEPVKDDRGYRYWIDCNFDEKFDTKFDKIAYSKYENDINLLKKGYFQSYTSKLANIKGYEGKRLSFILNKYGMKIFDELVYTSKEMYSIVNGHENVSNENSYLIERDRYIVKEDFIEESKYIREHYDVIYRLIQLKNIFSGVITQELRKTKRNYKGGYTHLLAKYEGELNEKMLFNADCITKFSYSSLNNGKVANGSKNYICLEDNCSGKKIPFKESKTLDLTWEDKNGGVYTEISNLITGDVHQEVFYPNRKIIKYLEDKKIAIHGYFEGASGSIGVINRSDTFIINKDYFDETLFYKNKKNENEMRTLSKSRIIYHNGDDINDNVNIYKLYSNSYCKRRTLKYKGVDYFQSNEKKMYYQDTIDSKGLTIKKETGGCNEKENKDIFCKNKHFVPLFMTYNFYYNKNNKFSKIFFRYNDESDISNTIFSYIISNERHNYYAFSVSEFKKINGKNSNGKSYITYDVINGNDKNFNIDYNDINDYLKNKKIKFKDRSIYSVKEEIKTGDGKLRAIISGVKKVNKERFPENNQAKYITFLLYNTNQHNDIRIPYQSVTYNIISDDKKHYYIDSKFYKKKKILSLYEIESIQKINLGKNYSLPIVIYGTEDIRNGSRFIKNTIFFVNGNEFAVISNYIKNYNAAGYQGVLLSKKDSIITIKDKSGQPLFSSLINDKNKFSFLEEINYLEKIKINNFIKSIHYIDNEGRLVGKIYVNEKRSMSEQDGENSIWDKQEYTYVNGDLPGIPMFHSKKRIDLINKWKNEINYIFIICFIFISALITSGIFGFSARLLRKKQLSALPAIGYKQGETTGEELVEIYGFEFGKEIIADTNTEQYIGETRDNLYIDEYKDQRTGRVLFGIFSEFRFFLKEYIEFDSPYVDSLIFTVDDLRLFYRVHIIAGNTRHASSFMMFIYFLAWKMLNDFYVNKNNIGMAIKTEIDRFDAVLRKGTRNCKGIGRGKSLNTYFNYDDLDEIFRTTKYIKAYISFFWKNTAENKTGWTISRRNSYNFPVIIRDKNKFIFIHNDNVIDTDKDELEKLLPYKTYAEVSGGLMGWKGWVQSIINVIPVYKYYAFSFTVIAIFNSLYYALCTLFLFGFGYFLLNYFEKKWQYQSINTSSVNLYDQPKHPYEGRKRPGQTKEVWINRLVWIIITIIHVNWNIYTFKYLLIASRSIDSQDIIYFNSIDRYVNINTAIVSYITIYLLVAYYLTDKHKFGFVSFIYTILFSILLFILFHVMGNFLGGALIVSILWIPFIMFSILDTYSFVNLVESLLSFGKAIYLRKLFNRDWGIINRSIKNGKLVRKFADTMIPQDSIDQMLKDNKDNPEIINDRFKVAYARHWNKIIEVLYLQHMISNYEFYNYYFLIENQDPNDYLAGTAHDPKKIIKRPENNIVEMRIFSYFEQIMMDKLRPRSFMELSLSLMIPIFNEGVVYNLDKYALLSPALNKKYTKDGHTFLTYLIDKNKTEWINLINMFILNIKKISNSESSDINRLISIKRGDSLFIENKHIIYKVNMWASSRFQPLSRTIRGINLYFESFKVLGSIANPKIQTIEVENIIDKNIQIMIGYQTYGDLPKNDIRKRAINSLMKEYPNIEVYYVDKYNGAFSSVKIQGVDNNEVPEEMDRIQLSGNPILGQGKPENINHMISFSRQRYIQVIDINQDMYIEDTFFIPNALQEFKRDDDIVLVGFPEDIFTEKYNYAAENNAHADRTFVTVVHRALDMMGKNRYHYGHPDIFRTDFVKTMGGVSKGHVVNEDIFAAYNLISKGKKCKNIEYIKAAKAREVSFSTVFGLFNKFSQGAAEQMQTRSLRDFRHGDVYGNFIDRDLRILTHFHASIGNYIKEPLVKYANLFYSIFLIYGGVSAFSAFPLEISLTFFGIILSQSLSFIGFIRILSDYGIDSNYGIVKANTYRIIFAVVLMSLNDLLHDNKIYAISILLIEFIIIVISPAIMRWVLLVIRSTPFFQAHILTHENGVNMAMKGKADYVATGRGHGLEHLFLFMPNKIGEMKPLYNFESTHLTPSLIGLCICCIGIMIYLNISLIFSFFTVLFFISGYFVPLFNNPGSTPLDIETKIFWKNYKIEIINYFYVLINGSMFNGEISVNRFKVLIHGFIFLSTQFVIGLILSPIGFVRQILLSKKSYVELLKKYK